MVALHSGGGVTLMGCLSLNDLEIIMQQVKLIGIDLGKHSFHLHGQDEHGNVVFRKKYNSRS
jgi:hypothetical protein